MKSHRRGKRAWLLMLPILLGGAIFWAKNARQNRVDEEFRRQITRDLATGAMPWLRITIHDEQNERSLGLWNQADTQAVLADVRLVEFSVLRASRTNSSSKIYLQFYAPSGDCYEQSGFAVALDGTWSSIGGGGDYALEWPGKWKGFELTPQSRHALRKRVLARWKKEIAAFQAESTS